MATDISTVSTNSSSRSVVSLDGNPVYIDLPANITNAILNFNFEFNGVPVTEGIEGELVLKGRYGNGRMQDIDNIDISNTNSYTLIGKYSQLYLYLESALNISDLIVYVDQTINTFKGLNHG